MEHVKIYVVGGAVRDILLGQTPKDIDYVVVGANHQYMIDRGYTKVGASFSVYLHPITNEEYALARTERKTGVGYNGFETFFDSSVTLEQDLFRRDLTMGSLAVNVDDWELFKLSNDSALVVDPYGGIRDLQAGIIRHTSNAFKDDPVRVLRAARFAARYGFEICNDTVDLMKAVVNELEYVPQERIWAEIEKGLMEDHPILMFQALRDCSAIAPLSGTLQPYAFVDSDMLNKVNKHTPIEIRFAYCSAGFIDADYEECKIPNNISRFSKLWHAHKAALSKWYCLTASEKIDILISMRGFSDKNIIKLVMQALCDYSSTDVEQFASDLRVASHIDIDHIVSTSVNGLEINQRIRSARVSSIT